MCVYLLSSSIWETGLRTMWMSAWLRMGLLEFRAAVRGSWYTSSTKRKNGGQLEQTAPTGVVAENI